MTVYVFKNKGVIDPRAITTFGVSSKEGKNPIGFFGTGLKYAIAVLLRNKCEVVIRSGPNTYAFSTVSARIRVNDFDVVTMQTNGEEQPLPLGFTTELGKTWEVWQAFRELACNTMDENGTFFASDAATPRFEDDETQIIVSGSAFSSAWAQRHSIILGSTPIEATSECERHRGASDWIYYRGVRAHKLEVPSLYTYNILRDLDLTEDRTLKSPYYAQSSVSLCASNSHDRKYIVESMTADSKVNYEGTLSSFFSYSDEFREEVTKLIVAFDRRLNLSAKEAIRSGNMSSFVTDETAKLSKTDAVRLERAKNFLLQIGYDISEYPVIVTTFLGEDVLGVAEDGKIYISTRAMMMGTKMVAGTLLEEYLHLKHGLWDESRKMQNFLFDALMTLGERATGECL